MPKGEKLSLTPTKHIYIRVTDMQDGTILDNDLHYVPDNVYPIISQYIINDTQGHLAGNQLIRDAADCINQCFGESTGGACFRFGGDEFAAVLKNCTHSEVQGRIQRFHKLEKEKGISVSIGSAYTKEIGNTSFKLPLGEADHNMYKEKEKAHSRR